MVFIMNLKKKSQNLDKEFSIQVKELHTKINSQDHKRNSSWYVIVKILNLESKFEDRKRQSKIRVEINKKETNNMQKIERIKK